MKYLSDIELKNSIQVEEDKLKKLKFFSNQRNSYTQKERKEIKMVLKKLNKLNIEFVDRELANAL